MSRKGNDPVSIAGPLMTTGPYAWHVFTGPDGNPVGHGGNRLTVALAGDGTARMSGDQITGEIVLSPQTAQELAVRLATIAREGTRTRQGDLFGGMHTDGECWCGDVHDWTGLISLNAGRRAPRPE